MTIKFPDVSQYDPDFDPSPYPALIAKATHGSSFVDPLWSTFKAWASRKPFCAYHWLNHRDLAAQADYAYHVVGGLPLMIDAEDVLGNTGYNGALDVSDILGFTAQYRALGGTCHLVYLPHWYWQDHMGSPDLSLFQTVGLHLVSSNYTTYSDTGPGWAPYGGLYPAQWQYTSTPFDMNAFKGTVSQWVGLINGRLDMSVLTQDQRDYLLMSAERYLYCLMEGINAAGDFQVWQQNGTRVDVPNTVHADLAAIKLGSIGNGLSDADRQAIKDLTDAVTTLNNRLASP